MKNTTLNSLWIRVKLDVGPLTEGSAQNLVPTRALLRFLNQFNNRQFGSNSTRLMAKMWLKVSTRVKVPTGDFVEAVIALVAGRCQARTGVGSR